MSHLTYIIEPCTLNRFVITLYLWGRFAGTLGGIEYVKAGRYMEDYFGGMACKEAYGIINDELKEKGLIPH